MAEIRILKPLTRPAAGVDPDLVAGLEALLAEAKAAKIQGIAYVTIASTGAGSYHAMGTGWRGDGADGNVHTMLGGLAVLQGRLLQEKQMFS